MPNQTERIDRNHFREDAKAIDAAAPEDRIGLFIKMCEKAISQVDAGRINIQTAAYAIFGLQVYPELYEHSEVTRRIFDLSASLELPEGHMPSNADELWREFLQCVSDMKKTAA